MTTIRKQDGAHVQDTPTREWTINIPEGRTNIELIGVYTADGRSAIPYDSEDFSNGVLTIYFGIDAVTGIARYEYDIDTTDTTTSVVTSGGVVNINIHQYSQGGSSQL